VSDHQNDTSHLPAMPGALSRLARFGAVLCGTLACGAIWLTASASAATSISTNWAGYVSVAAARVGARFSSVSGSWTQPAATCTSGRAAYSAVWVGLGGYKSARALEQVGTDADCTAAGRASYSTWYELLPTGPVSVPLKVHPGDRMSASVTVRSSDVTLRVRNLSTGARFTTTRRVSNIDVSSAEWIVEAPSVCVSSSSCLTLPLTNFGTTLFSSATGTARGHTGTIDDADWSAMALELQQQNANATAGGSAVLRRAATRTLTVATPSAVAASNGSFSVTWGERSIHTEQPARPTLPALSGGTL
jgi:WD40 repeat protein